MNPMILLFMILFFGCSSAKLEVSKDTTPTQDTPKDTNEWVTWDECAHDIGDHPCNFALMNQDGDIEELYRHHNKVIVLDLSAMWCGVCNVIATKGDELTAKYGEDKFVWITILIDNPAGLPPELADLQLWVTTYGVESPVLAGNRDMVDLTAQEGYPITSWPTLVVIDQDMVLRHGLNGWSESVITGWVEELL